jgi:hypothetical protein
MTSQKIIYPQEWPDYLHNENVPFCDEALPAGCHTLPFEKLEAKPFEQFCWWLIQKDYRIAGCQRLGGNGKSQGGIDLFAFDKVNPDGLVVFECKCWGKFPPARLTETIDRFLAGVWVNQSSRFILILAQQEIDDLAQPWTNARSRLAEHGIEGELWTGTQLTSLVQRYPDILSKFFPGAALSNFANEWMQRVGFIERLHKALTHKQPEIRTLANNFLSHGIGQSENLEKRAHQDGHWSLETPWVHVNSILPGQRFYPGSASVIIRREDLGGITVLLSQKWMLHNFLGSIAAPIDQRYRPFIESEPRPASLPSQKYVISLENCRFNLEQDGINELVNAADELTKIYFESLIGLEREWEAIDFPFISSNGVKVAICNLPTWVWKTILEFMYEHDVSKGNTEWHIFDGMSSIFKVYTNKPHAKFDIGYHCFLYPEQDIEGLSYSDEITLLWSPPFDDEDGKIGSRTWMSCEQTYLWLNESLIPAVQRWAGTESILTRFRKKRPTRIAWNDDTELTDLRIPTLLRNKHYISIGLIKTVETLQGFYNSRTESERVYVLEHQMKSLRKSIIPVLQGKRGYPGYIRSNLGIERNCKTHEEIINALNAQLNEQRTVINSFIVDTTLRAFLEALDDEDEWVPDKEKNDIFDALTPFMKFYDQQMLVQRHTRWLSPNHQ